MCISITEQEGKFCARFTKKHLLDIVAYGDSRLEAITKLIDLVPVHFME
jgi:hypothetical protein